MFLNIKRQLSRENYFLAAIFLLPTYLLRLSVFGLPTNLWEVLAIAGIILGAWKIGENIAITGYEKKIAILFLAIIIGLTLGMVKSGNYQVGLGVIKSWFIIPFLFAYLASKVIENKEKAYFSLFLSVFFVSVVALIYKFSGVVTFDGRLQAFFNSPNYLAMYVAPGIIIGMIMLAQNQKSKIKNQRFNLKIKIFYYFLLATMIVSLFFTYSYTAWLSVLITLVIIFLLNCKFSKRYLSILILIALSLLFVLKDTAKFQDLVSFDERSSLASRAMIWESAGKILSDNYILGIGPGNFQAKYLEYQKFFPPYLEWAVPHPHNIFLAFWLSSGIIGLFSFFGILYLFFRRSISGRRLNDVVNIISLGIIIYFLLHGLVDTTYFKNDLAVIFWLAIFSISTTKQKPRT